MLGQVSSWSVPPAAQAASALLAGSLRYSLSADNQYVRWIQLLLAGNSRGAKKAYQLARQGDAITDASKAAFLHAYNSFRAGAGVAPLPSTFFF
jgi:hypothetical protein